MTVRKINLIALSILALIPAFMTYVNLVSHSPDWSLPLIMLLFMVVAWGIAIFVGVILSAIVKRPGVEPILYLSTHSAMLLIIIIYAVHSFGDRKPREPLLANKNANHFLVSLDNHAQADSMDYIRVAFRKFESRFADPNSFILERFASLGRDTVINGIQNTSYQVYFTYLDHNALRHAQVTVLGDSATINAFDAPQTTYWKDPSAKPGFWGRVPDLEEVKKTLKDLPDSTRDQIEEALTR